MPREQIQLSTYYSRGAGSLAPQDQVLANAHINRKRYGVFPVSPTIEIKDIFINFLMTFYLSIIEYSFL